MRRCWFFIFPFLGSCPIASRHGQWPDRWAGVTEWCSLLAGHREITGGGEASIERGRSGGSQFRIVEPQWRPALQIRRHLAHRSAEGPAAAIAGNSVISNPTHVSLLPSSWRTLYELTRLPDGVLEARITDLPVAEDTAAVDGDGPRVGDFKYRAYAVFVRLRPRGGHIDLVDLR